VVGLGAHGLEDVFVEEPAVERQGAEHDAVHAGPSDQRRGRALDWDIVSDEFLRGRVMARRGK
jgi:hypothetical protein